MNLRRTPKKTTPSGKVFVLSFDGVSGDFISRHGADGLMPGIGSLLRESDLKELGATRPAVSLVSWASYMTGLNPGRHGVYGFADRQPRSLERFIATGATIAAPTLWEMLSRAGKRVVVMNVPCTYPPRPVMGVLVAGFLSPSVDVATYPPGIGRRLKDLHYRLDVSELPGKCETGTFLADADTTLRKRFETARHLMEEETWDFFHLHVMETDRINHLLWGDYEDGGPGREDFLSFYRTLDDLVGETIARLPSDCDVVLLSNHGFCRLRREVYLNRYLEERDWLSFPRRLPRKLTDLKRESKAYSLMPGRIYLNLRGREPQGSVEGRDEYRGCREGLRADLLELRDPDTGEPVAAEVLRGEEILSNPSWGDFPQPASERRPTPFDLLVVPRDGYNLKGHLDRPGIFGENLHTGMHSSEGAFVALRGRTIASDDPHMLDLFPTVLEMMGVEAEDGLDGSSILRERVDE